MILSPTFLRWQDSERRGLSCFLVGTGSSTNSRRLYVINYLKEDSKGLPLSLCLLQPPLWLKDGKREYITFPWRSMHVLSCIWRWCWIDQGAIFWQPLGFIKVGYSTTKCFIKSSIQTSYMTAWGYFITTLFILLVSDDRHFEIS